MNRSPQLAGAIAGLEFRRDAVFRTNATQHRNAPAPIVCHIARVTVSGGPRQLPGVGARLRARGLAWTRGLELPPGPGPDGRGRGSRLAAWVARARAGSGPGGWRLAAADARCRRRPRRGALAAGWRPVTRACLTSLAGLDLRAAPGQDREHRTSLQRRRAFHDRDVGHARRDAPDLVARYLRVGRFTPAKPDFDFDLVALLEEAASRAHAHLQVMVVGPRPQPNLLDLGDVLVLLGVAGTLVLIRT